MRGILSLFDKYISRISLVNVPWVMHTQNIVCSKQNCSVAKRIRHQMKFGFYSVLSCGEASMLTIVHEHGTLPTGSSLSLFSEVFQASEHFSTGTSLAHGTRETGDGRPAE